MSCYILLIEIHVYKIPTKRTNQVLTDSDIRPGGLDFPESGKLSACGLVATFERTA